MPACRRALLLSFSLALTPLALSACDGFQPQVVDTASLPAGGLQSGFDPDVTAANIAAWAFADSSRTYGRPLEGARAAAALEYMAGSFNTSPRWSNISAITKDQLVAGRQQLRTVLGTAPGATSQQILNGLTGAVTALSAGNREAAVQALNSPTFTRGGEQTLALLGNLPYMQVANVATQRAANQMFEDDQSGMSL